MEHHLQMFYMSAVFANFYLTMPTDGNDDQILAVNQPNTLKVEPGGSVTINCTFKSDLNSYTVFWTLGCANNTTLENNPCYKHRMELKNLNKQLTIANLAESDTAIYCCHVELSRGNKASGSGTKVEVRQRKCESAESDNTTGTLSLAMDILRISSLVILIILVSILIKKSS